ncbi:MAG: hypothetical protein LBS11_03800 [Oscillospiraceae bacterium]|jgi:hypothetical protein|nr:hypothetical protein [Oscillospiraceae bacterium]
MATVPFTITALPDPADAWVPGTYTIADGGIDWSALERPYSTDSTITLRAAPGVAINRLNAPLFATVGAGSVFEDVTIEYAGIEADYTVAPIVDSVQALGALVAVCGDITLNNCQLIDGVVRFVYIDTPDGNPVCVGGLVGYAEFIRADRCGNGAVVAIERGGGISPQSRRGVYVGGIAACCVNGGSITNSWNDGGVYLLNPMRESYLGGIVGFGDNLQIAGCWNNGYVDIDGDADPDGQPFSVYAGGIYGYMSGGDACYCMDYSVEGSQGRDAGDARSTADEAAAPATVTAPTFSPAPTLAPETMAAPALAPTAMAAPALSLSLSLSRGCSESMLESMLNLITSLANMQHTVNCISDIETRIVNDALADGDPDDFVEINDSVSDVIDRIGKINKPLACSLCCVTNVLSTTCFGPTVTSTAATSAPASTPAPALTAGAPAVSTAGKTAAKPLLYSGSVQAASASGVGISGLQYRLYGNGSGRTLETDGNGNMPLDGLEPGEYTLAALETKPGQSNNGLDGLWEADEGSPYKVSVSDEGRFAITDKDGGEVSDMTLYRFCRNGALCR